VLAVLQVLLVAEAVNAWPKPNANPVGFFFWEGKKAAHSFYIASFVSPTLEIRQRLWDRKVLDRNAQPLPGEKEKKRPSASSSY